MPKSWALRCLIPKPCLKQPSQPHCNAFKIAVRHIRLCDEKTTFPGTKSLQFGYSWDLDGQSAPIVLRKGMGSGWALVQLDPAAYSHRKSSSPGRDTTFFSFSFFLFSFCFLLLSLSFVSNLVLRSPLSWHLPSKFWHWGIDPLFFRIINGNAFLLQPSNLHRQHCQNALNFFWKQQMTTAG